MKFIFVLAISLLFTVTVGTVLNNSKIKHNPNLISPTIAGISSQNPKDNNSIFGWQIFVNNYYGYKIKHPSNIDIKNMRDGDVSLEKSSSVNIIITQGVLVGKDSLNTVIEKEIDTKKTQLKDQFDLITDISPIALSSTTAQTFTSKENGKHTTYFYIPQENNKYLLIINQSLNDGSADYILSEDIVYSLELSP